MSVDVYERLEAGNELRMKIEAIGLCRFNGDTPEPVLLDNACNLAEYGWFQQGSAKEFLIFAIKTLAKRLPAGIQCIEYEGKFCYAFVTSDGLSAIAVADKEYPARVAISLLKELNGEMKSGEHAARWRTATVDGTCKIARLPATLLDYQKPEKVDKILAVDKSLVETKAILHKTIEAVLERGEKLDDLVDKSAALSATSRAFYKTAKKTNSSCCIIM